MFNRSVFYATRQLSRPFKPLQSQTTTRFFHPSLATMVAQVGDSIPNVDFHEGGPGNKVNSLDLFGTGDAVLVGVPAAFSPNCTDDHVPGYVGHPDIKKHKVFVFGVNDAFVMKAWSKQLDKDGASGIRFLADPHAEFSGKLGLLFDAEPFFGNKRCTRSAIKVKDGKITSIATDADPRTVINTTAEKNL